LKNLADSTLAQFRFIKIAGLSHDKFLTVSNRIDPGDTSLSQATGS